MQKHNHIGTFSNYKQVQKAKSDLAQNTSMQCEKVLLFITKLATFSNTCSLHRGQFWSSSGINSHHDTVLTFFQIKPNHTLSKNLWNSLSLKTVSDSASLVLPCQKILLLKGIKKHVVLDSIVLDSIVYIL